MLNIHDLERRWLKYKIKSYLPLFFSTVLLISVVILAFIFYPTMEKKKTVQPQVNTINNEKKIIEIAKPEEVPQNTQNKTMPLDVPQNTQTVAQEESQTLMLKPSLRFMDNIEEGLNPYIEEEVAEVPEEESESSTYTPEDEPVETAQVEPPVIETKKTLSITRNDDESDIKDVIRRFKKNKNPTLSLFIAKRYYALGKYQNSYNYALMTNQIDKNIDESWIIFSKSLVKLGQHELAIATLKSYLRNAKSTQAEILLHKIESGEFR